MPTLVTGILIAALEGYEQERQLHQGDGESKLGLFGTRFSQFR
jgi:hypothetical protein